MRASPLGQRLFYRPPIVIAPTGSAFDPAHKDASWTLSNSNFTATLSPGAGNSQWVFGTTAGSSGYVDFIINNLGDEAFLGIGISNARFTSTSTSLGDSGQNDKGYYPTNGDVLANGNGHGGPYGTLATGGTVRWGWSSAGNLYVATKPSGGGFTTLETQDVNAAYGWSSGYPVVMSSTSTSSNPQIAIDASHWVP